MIKLGEVVGYKNSGNVRDVVLEEMLKMFAQKANIELIKNCKGKCKLAVSDTLDVTSLAFVKQTFGKSKMDGDLLPIVRNKIKPLYLFLDKEVLLYAILKDLDFKEKKYLIHSSKSQTKEVLLYAKIRNLNFKKNIVKNDKILDFVNHLEQKHPEVKRAIVNSYLELYN